jgi:hypothetical protein
LFQNRQRPLAAPVDVLILPLEQVVPDRDFILVPEQTKKYEEFPVMHPYLGDAPANAIASLRSM